MTPAETVALARYVKAACPAQAFDEYTPDIWHELLSDLDFGDCRAAVVAIGKRERWIAPADIRGEVGRIRRERLDRTVEAVPVADPDDVPAYLAQVREGRRETAAMGTPGDRRRVAEMVRPAFRQVGGKS